MKNGASGGRTSAAQVIATTAGVKPARRLAGQSARPMMASAAEGVSENPAPRGTTRPARTPPAPPQRSASRRPATPSHSPTSAQRPTTESSALATWSAWSGSATAELANDLPDEYPEREPRRQRHVARGIELDHAAREQRLVLLPGAIREQQQA